MTKAKFFVLLPLVTALLLAAGCGGGDEGAKSVPSDAVAVVGDETITKEEFDRAMEQTERAYEAQDRQFPKQGTEDWEQVKQSTVRFLVRQAQFDQKSEELGVEVTDEEIDKRLTQIKKQYFQGSQKRYEESREQQGLTEEEVRDSIRAQILSEKLFAKVTSDVRVGNSEIASFYRENRQQYRTPASRDVRHILVKKRQLADRLYRQLRDGGNFAKLAKNFSQDPGSKAQGGKLTVARGQTVPPFDKAAFNLDVRQISSPVKTQFGFHIIQPLTKTKPAKVTPLAQVRESIRQQILQNKRNEAMTEWVEQLGEDLRPRYQVGYRPPQATQQQQ